MKGRDLHLTAAWIETHLGVSYLHFNMYMYSSKSACPVDLEGAFTRKAMFYLAVIDSVDRLLPKKEEAGLLKISLKNDQWHAAKSWSFLHADLWGEDWSPCWYSKLLRGSENLLHSFCLNTEFYIFLLNRFLVVDWVTAFNSLSGFYVQFIYLYWNFLFEH